MSSCLNPYASSKCPATSRVRRTDIEQTTRARGHPYEHGKLDLSSIFWKMRERMTNLTHLWSLRDYIKRLQFSDSPYSYAKVHYWGTHIKSHHAMSSCLNPYASSKCPATSRVRRTDIEQTTRARGHPYEHGKLDLSSIFWKMRERMTNLTHLWSLRDYIKRLQFSDSPYSYAKAQKLCPKFS